MMAVAFLYPRMRLNGLIVTARTIWQIERGQAERIRSGDTLRKQLQFADYLTKRSANQNCTIRQHLPPLELSLNFDAQMHAPPLDIYVYPYMMSDAKIEKGRASAAF